VQASGVKSIYIADDATGTLQCDEGSVISILDASYGAGQERYQASGYLNRGACHLKGSRAHFVKQCNNRARCDVKVSSGDFGSDPCSGTAKVAAATWKCVGRDSAPTSAPPQPTSVQPQFPGIQFASAPNDRDVSLRCDGNQVINVLDASYGADQGYYLSNGYIRRGCHAPESFNVISRLCHGKRECSTKVNADVFNGGRDACPAHPVEQAVVTYRCADQAAAAVPPAPPALRVAALGVTVIGAPAAAGGGAAAAGNDGVVRVGDNEIHIHVTQHSMPQPNAVALAKVETKLDALHNSALNKIENIMDDIENHRAAKKPCLRRLQNTITRFKDAFIQEANKVERITKKYSYADDAPTLM
jgi:hypothetical protein